MRAEANSQGVFLSGIRDLYALSDKHIRFRVTMRLLDHPFMFGIAVKQRGALTAATETLGKFYVAASPAHRVQTLGPADVLTGAHFLLILYTGGYTGGRCGMPESPMYIEIVPWATPAFILEVRSTGPECAGRRSLSMDKWCREGGRNPSAAGAAPAFRLAKSALPARLRPSTSLLPHARGAGGCG